MGKLGYSTYTLTDLTETLPISLVLETNKEQNIQTKEGEFYTPNFDPKTGGEELIITPSLFLGSIEREVPTNYSGGSYIYYETGEMEDGSIHEKQYYYYKGNESEEVYVDIKGRLHYKKNLTENLTIEAYIVGFKNKVDQDYITSELVRAQNPITILLLEQGKGIYTLVISSEGNREHFEENNKKEIKLTATLYKGAEPILDEVEYEWDIVTDNDDDPNNDFKEEGNIITIQRADVDNIQVYQCTATFNGLEFSSQKIIRDFTDGYTNQLIANSSLILTPNNLKVTLTNQVWYQTGIINGDNITDQEKARFEYEWILLKSDNETEFVLSGEKNKKLEINLNNSIYPKENFSILGKVTIDNKTITVNYADIKYQPVAYSVNVSPKTIFIPTNADGTYRGTRSFTQEIKFQLLDDKKQSLDYISETDSFPVPQQNISVVSQTPGKWDFTLEFNLIDFTGWEENQSSQTYQFYYTYLNTEFTEEFEVVKNYAGANGDQGFSGYTIDLSNEFHAFAGGEMRADSDQSTSCLVSAYFGDARKTIKKIEIGNINNKTEVYPTPTSNEIEYIVPNNKGYLYFSSQKKQDNEININIKTASSGDKFLTGIEPISIYITIEGQDGKDLIFSKTFTYTINYNGKSYFLNLSDNNIKYSEPTNTYSPNQITISALCRETNGTARPYSEGKIIYSIDEGKNWKYYGNSPIITNNGIKLESIMIRLYSSLAKDITSSATLNESLLNENSKYLLDTETIPILTSMEGYEFGGENLIRWSKTLSSEANKWNENSENISITSNEDFSEAVFNGTSTEEYSILKSPKILISEELRGKTLCLSFDFYCTNYSNLDSTNYAIFIAAAAENSISAKTRWGTIGSIKNTEVNSTFIFNETPQNEKWVRVYKTFKLDSSSLNNSASTSAIENCKYFWIEFVAMYNSDFKIKKPKLELGNIPSSWSSSPYDIDYNDVLGANLLSFEESYLVTFSSSAKEIKCNLEKNTSYTLSWSTEESEGTGNFTLKIYSSNEDFSSKTLQITKELGLSNSSYTFTTGDYNFVILSFSASISHTLTQLKLEKGTFATSYSVGDNQIADLIDTLTTGLNNTSNAADSANTQIITINTTMGNIATNVNNLQSALNDLQGSSISMDEITGSIVTTTNQILTGAYTGTVPEGVNLAQTQTYFSQLQKEIKLVSSANPPYIQIGTYVGDQAPAEQAKNLYTKITSSELSFWQNNIKVAFISGSKLQINKAQFLESFSIGTKQNSGELMVSVTPSGVGFLWEV